MYSYKVCQKTSAEDQSPSRWIKHQLSILGLYLEILLATSDPLLYDLSFRSHSEVQSTGRSPNRRADELDQRALAGPDSLKLSEMVYLSLRGGQPVCAPSDDQFTPRNQSIPWCSTPRDHDAFREMQNDTHRHSMYAIYAYIGVVWGVNVGIYSIHGVSGIEQDIKKHMTVTMTGVVV